MSFDKESLNDSQKEVIVQLSDAMDDLFKVFVKVDAAGLQITDALECIGIEVPMLVRPAINQMSARMKDMRKEELPAA